MTFTTPVRKDTTTAVCPNAGTSHSPPTLGHVVQLYAVPYLWLHELVRLPVSADDVPPLTLEPLGQVGPDETSAASDANLEQ